MKFTFEGEGVQELRDLGLFLIGGDPVKEENVGDFGPEAAQRLNDAHIKAMNSLETENSKLQKALQDAGAHAAQLERQVEELEAENKRLAGTIIRLQSAQAPAGQPKALKPVEKPKKAEKPAEKPQEPAEKPQDEEPAPAPEVPFEEDKPKMDMVAARKILADLNKEAGSNVARATLKKLGYANLKVVPEDKLQEVVDAAREEARTYA